MTNRLDSIVRVIAGLAAATALTGVAWGACVYHASTCTTTTGSGFCGSAVTACENGLVDAGENTPGKFVCAHQDKRVIRCKTYTGCAPGACSTPPSGINTGCQGGTPTQCCYCDTYVSYTEDPEGKQAWFCEDEDPCPPITP